MQSISFNLNSLLIQLFVDFVHSCIVVTFVFVEFMLFLLQITVFYG